MASYVVVGASRGLGYGFVKQLSANASNKIVGIVRNQPAVQAQLDSDGLANVRLLTADMTDHEALTAAAKEAAAFTGGNVDYLIVNGAYVSKETEMISPTGYIGKEKLLEEDLQKAFRTNVMGVVFAINAFLPLVRASSIKKVIVISTGLADSELTSKSGHAMALAYTASKAGLNVVVQEFANELKPEGIAFLALSPGVVDTSGVSSENLTPEQISSFQKLVEGIRKYEPTFNGPITIEQSIGMQLKVIHNFTLAESGSFLSHFGNKRWV